MKVFGFANSLSLAGVCLFGKGKCEFGGKKGGKHEKKKIEPSAVCGNECLRLGIQLGYRVITTAKETANQKDLDHNKPLPLM